MRRKDWQILGALVTLVLGSLLHFTYDWSGESPIIGLFSPVNESVWEHLKLLATPMLLFALVEWFTYGKSHPGFLPVRVLSIWLGMGVIVLLFYLYTAILGKNFLPADVAIFIIAVFIAYFFSNRLLAASALSSKSAFLLGLVLLLLLVVVLAVFTFAPPHWNLFLDPVTNTYGIQRV